MSKTVKIIAIVGVSLLLHFYFYGSEHTQKVDYALYDSFTTLNNHMSEYEDTFYTVVIDIDEKSLKALGQWPWPRVINAQLINKISKMEPSAIGINILFPEEDRTSLLYMEKFYKNFFNLDLKFNNIPNPMKDNDKLFSEIILRSNVTLATYFRDNSGKSPCNIERYRENYLGDIKTKYSADTLICNYETLQNGVENFGFINAWRDSDGTFRRIPLYMNYKGNVFPSFALATLLSLNKEMYTESKDETLLVHFSDKKPKVISALDLLSNKVSLSEIQGKVVIVGSSIIGLDSHYSIYTGEEIPDNIIHAVVLDNLLSHTFLVQPERYKKINIILSFLLSIAMVILLFNRRYIHMTGILFMIFIVGFLWTWNIYLSGVYVSIAYLFLPLFYFLVFILFYHLWVISNERTQQEKLLIRQSKLASMGEMITLIAHQWRQPLSVVNGIVLNIDIDHRKKILDENRLNDHLNKIEETTAYLSKTINDFTDFFSKNKGKESFYFTDIIEQSLQLTGVANQKNIEILYRKKVTEELMGHRSELMQSILIILNNAIYVTLNNELTQNQAYIVIDATLEDEVLTISIEDNGGGIENKHLKHLFDPYFTTKDKANGTGLGLYILKLIVEDSMNGKVYASNGEDGAIFTMKIPIKE